MLRSTESQPEAPRARRNRLRVLESALALFSKRGYERTTFQHIAAHASVSVAQTCRWFPTKEHLVLALYDRLATALEEWGVEMPAGTVAERFQAVMEQKLALLAPHRRTLTALAARALDPVGRASVLGPGTEVVRSKVAGVFWLAVVGATDAAPTTDGEAERLARMLYAAHLLLVLLFLQEADEGAKTTREAMTLLTAAITMRSFAAAFLAGPIGARLDGLFGDAFGTARSLAPDETADLVLDRIFRRRRSLPGVPTEASPAARALHLARLRAFVDAKEPIQLALPAFPAKAPNLQKVLGKLPDTAESLALESLRELLREIGEAHRPGAELVICSDGGVFADLVGVPDADVRAYRRALEQMIAELELDGQRAKIQIFGLEDAFGQVTPDRARKLLLESYGPTEDEIRGRAERSEVHRAQLDGIHRMLFEDEVVRVPTISRTQARKVTRARAYEVVRRSEAWGDLVAVAFPRAVRLSIHPQPEVSSKIGIAFLDASDAWLTPWHGVALVEGDRTRLVRRHEAEALGATVVEDEGVPSHMELRA